MSAASAFPKNFKALTSNDPFPWQQALYDRFIAGSIPKSASLSTGLGKTSVIAIWLLALMERSDLTPRRLVYVVNRRTVVDQTTAEVERLREKLRRLNWRFDSLAVSTLRGQFADNHEWSEDPARPAVICGTVDMIGSRLLFGGYRIGFKSRPLHAGFLGQDALLIHDEAHLEPAFQRLVETIEREQERNVATGALPWRKLQVMAMTATAREKYQEPESCFTIQPDDLQHTIVKRRIAARKHLELVSCDNEKNDLVNRITQCAEAHSESGDAVLVFLRRVDDALQALDKIKNSNLGCAIVLTGTMRGHERDQLVRHPVFARFLPESDRPEGVCPAEGTVYLVCTSAGEVGVNLSADHMVCDLSTFDSMVQRLGRVNRFGDRSDTRVHIVHPAPDEFAETDPLTPARQATLGLLEQLDGDGSPSGLDGLNPGAQRNAFAPDPVIPEATDIQFDAWALTTIRGRLPGRPELEPYLHGVAEWEPPRTSVAWREEVSTIDQSLIDRHGAEYPQELLDDYPLKPHELLSDRTDRVLRELQKLAQIHPSATAWIVDAGGRVTLDTLNAIANPAAKNKREKQPLERAIAECTVILPPQVGGLSEGMLDGGADNRVRDLADEWQGEDGRARNRFFSEDRVPADLPEGMALIRTIDTKPDAEEYESDEPEADATKHADEDSRPNQQSGRFWHWFVRPRDAEDATRSSMRPIPLEVHTHDVVDRAEKIVEALDWPEQWKELEEAVILAAKLHDLGKRREPWQRLIGNPNPSNWFAKSGKPADGPPWRPKFINPYRHEFGSLLDALDPDQEHRARIDALSEEMRDVVLHLIASHHGYARPHFPPEAIVDPDHTQDAAEQAVVEAMRRYARLQRHFGRWGLAYLESLLRAADWAASADPSENGASP